MDSFHDGEIVERSRSRVGISPLYRSIDLADPHGNP
jgi:hypothetical protein